MPTSEELKQRKATLESERSSLWKQWETETAELKAKLDAANKPFGDADKRLKENIDATESAIWQAEREERAAPWKNRMPKTAEEFPEWWRNGGIGPQKLFSMTCDGMVKVPQSIPGVTLFGFYEGNSESQYEKGYVAFDNGTQKVIGFLHFEPSKHPGDSTYLKECEVRGRKPSFIITDNWSKGIAQPLATFLATLKGEEEVCYKHTDHNAARSKVSHRTTADSGEEPMEDYTARIVHTYAPKSVVEAWYANVNRARSKSYYSSELTSCGAVNADSIVISETGTMEK